jgi:hypothetical protein
MKNTKLQIAIKRIRNQRERELDRKERVNKCMHTSNKYLHARVHAYVSASASRRTAAGHMHACIYIYMHARRRGPRRETRADIYIYIYVHRRGI